MPVDRHVATEQLTELLRRTHLSAPSDLARVLAEQAEALGAVDVSTYLVDLEQTTLMHLPAGAEDRREPLTVTGTMAGRAYASTAILRASEPEGQRLWIPLLDGTERLGVLGIAFPEPEVSEDTVALCERFAHLAALLIVTKQAYGDALEVVRRRRPVTIATELVRELAPPLVFATDDVVVAGMLEPAYDNGGDALDYTLNDRTLHLAVFDAMGHGLPAAGVAAFALAAYRNSRRRGHSLPETHASMDEAVREQFPEDRFVTALLAELDLDSGALTWLSAGHPPPLLVRHGRAKELAGTPTIPLGLADGPGAPATVNATVLEPGDNVLLYTDGLTEVRNRGGELLEAGGLSRFVEREAAAQQTAPEVLRRLRQAVLGDELAELRDDATALLVAWRDGGDRRLLPETVDD